MSNLFQAAPNGDPAYHALIIGVSRYTHLVGGTGPRTEEPLATQLDQLSAAATSAVRVAMWIRDHFQHPDAGRGSIRLLVSPSDGETPLPGDVEAPTATHDNVRAAITEWRRDVRASPENVAILYIAGHGLQTSNEGGILLLEDFGAPDAPTPLHAAVDVESVRRGIVADPNRPDTATPKLQFYFYDACRINPAATAGYDELKAGICLDLPRGASARASWVCFGARPRDYAYADPQRRVTLYSQAFLDCLESRAPVDADGRTVSFDELQSTLEEAVSELAARYGEVQETTLGGGGKLAVPVHLRPVTTSSGMSRDAAAGTRSVRVAVEPQLPVLVRLADSILANETQMHGDPVELAIGEYQAVVPLPWGGEYVHPFSVDPGDGELLVHLQVPPDRLAAPPPASRGAVVSGGGGLRRSASGGAIEATIPWALRFLKWAGDGFELHDAPPDPGPYQPELTQRVAGGVVHTMTVRDSVATPVLIQIGSDVGWSPVVALPLGVGFGSCDVHVRVGHTGVSASAQPGNPEASAVAGYLNSGRADRALMTMTATAEQLLQGKMADPIGAIIGGYALLKLHELDRMHDWPDNLANWFETLPDGAVIAGAVAARRGDDEAAGNWFKKAMERGIPIFSEGMSLLVAETNALIHTTDASDIADVARQAAALAPLADFFALCTTLHVHDRVMSGIPVDTGWLQVDGG